jgi:tetratricopeptide (TPR) repeat protein
MGEGAGFLNARAYSNAIDSFACIITQLDPGYAGAYVQRAVAFSGRQDYARAVEDYTRAIELGGALTASYNNRGVVHAAMQEYDLALEDFNAALEQDANYIPAYNNRAVVATLRGDYEGAIADLEQAIAISGIEDVVTELRRPDRPANTPRPQYNPQHAQSYALLGIIYSARALDNYNKYLLLRGSGSDARIQSAAGALESRFTFELRLDDGTWLLSADFLPTGEERVS